MLSFTVHAPLDGGASSQSASNTASWARGFKRLNETVLERAAGHAGSIAAPSGTTLHGFAIST